MKQRRRMGLNQGWCVLAAIVRCAAACRMTLNGLLMLSTLVRWQVPAEAMAGGPPAQPSRNDAANKVVVEQSRTSLLKAVDYYAQQVARHGGYVYFTSEDLMRRWGEGETGPDTIFVQPPGTPAVGEAFLLAYQATNEPRCLEAAVAAADALVAGQLESGGWAQAIHFSPPASGRWGHYRHRKGGKDNRSSLDDDQTQSALRFLMRIDREQQFRHPAIHEAVEYGLNRLLAAQFPNGGFPQGWVAAAPDWPVQPASYPTGDWKTDGRVKNYWDFYTLNDGLAGSMAETLILASDIYQQPRYREAVERLGQFLILAQMPDPQPGWCQQYNDQMQPIWARKFEPPAIAGAESQDVMRTLLRLASFTGDREYLVPIERALPYFRSQCVLPDDQLARFYELHSNRPLYLNRQYQLTYETTDLPSHYSWMQTSRLESIARDVERARNGSLLPPSSPKPVEVKDVQAILTDLDPQGRWMSVYQGEKLVGQPKFERGFRFLSSEVFVGNVSQLSRFLLAQAVATQPGKPVLDPGPEATPGLSGR
jgi:PelA/Pel-15E family pectate lyase